MGWRLRYLTSTVAQVTTNNVWWQSAVHRRFSNSTAVPFVTMFGDSASAPSLGAATTTLTILQHSQRYHAG